MIYRPNDVMFIEVYVNNPLNKTPITTSLKDANGASYFLTIEITDPIGTKISSQYAEV